MFVYFSRAGLRAGDVIVAIDDMSITNARQVYAATESRDKLTITIMRQGQKMIIENVHTEKT